jgi:DNA-directed RNA polymerase subunit RPC12/RpoP
MTKEKAIKTLEIIKYVIVWEDYPIFYQLALDMAIEALKQQNCEDCISREGLKIGHWVIIDDCEHFIAKCSECGKVVDSRMINDYSYCPNCGEKMEVI